MTQKAISRIFWWIKIGWVSGLTGVVHLLLRDQWLSSNPEWFNIGTSFGVLCMYSVLVLLGGVFFALGNEDKSDVPVWMIVLAVVFGVPFYPWVVHSIVKDRWEQRIREIAVVYRETKREMEEVDRILRAEGVEPLPVDWNLFEKGKEHN